MVHLSTAVDGFDNMHVEQVQLAPTFLLGGCLPAAAQSNPLTGGRGASQMVHLSTAVDGFDNMHVEQVQLAPASLLAATRSNPLTGGAEGFVAA